MSDNGNLSVDEALAEVTAIIDRLNAMGPGDPGRAGLVARRDELRKSARDASVASRSDDILRYERDQARRRIAELDSTPVKKSWVEKRNFRWINDPGAYSNRINQMIAEQNATEREQLERRIVEIDAKLHDTGDSQAI
ncbi:MAG: hypothetical protein IIC70_00605 [Acidobacteria bacterium]|nr:hypothetical protein [Acidobacteriota bacterium]MCH8128381.1 hypothetical protein [Acidobacteriota bacterium]MCH8992837.1 hypothetical protein [Acidobacteriota bacterium]